jgi:N-dimethylarginine dimethylaminohydrolase
MLKARVPRLLPVEPDNARRLGCNALVADGNVILPEGCESTAARLEQEGFRVHTLPLGSYARHGAGPKALASKIGD